MSVISDLIRGHTETIILANLVRGDSYGYKINKTIKDVTGGEFELKEATLYTAFKRLEESGCISAYWGDETTGARRRYYTVTRHGREVYAELKDEWKKIKTLIDILIEADTEDDPHE